MNFLKKIFGRSTAPAVEKAYPFKQRSVRVPLQSLHRVSLKLIEPTSDKTFMMSNISTGGMAILHEGVEVFQRDLNVRGQLKFNTDLIEVRGVIRHRSDSIAGCEFTSGTQDLKKMIESFLAVEISAMKLNRIADNYLQQDPRGKVIWFSDGKQNELYGVMDDKGIAAFHMSFLGNYIEGERGKPARSGVVAQEAMRETPGHKRSELLDMSEALSDEKLKLALKFMRNIEKLPADLLGEIETYLQLK